MSREIRMVPPDWEHPTDERGDYIPLYGSDFSDELAKWTAEKEKWDQGLVRDWSGPGDSYKPIEKEYTNETFEDYWGAKPVRDEYMPSWTPEEATHLMMYETFTEGTPISPAFSTPEELARWLADNGASAFGSTTATYENWLSMIHAGWAPSAVYTPGNGMQSGVAAIATREDTE